MKQSAPFFTNHGSLVSFNRQIEIKNRHAKIVMKPCKLGAPVNMLDCARCAQSQRLPEKMSLVNLSISPVILACTHFQCSYIVVGCAFCWAPINGVIKRNIVPHCVTQMY